MQREASCSSVVTRSYRFSCRQVDGLWRLLVEKLIEETDVGKRPSGHNGVVTSPRAVRVVVSGVQTAKRAAAENVDGFTPTSVFHQEMKSYENCL